MARGQPDFGMYASRVSAASASDIGELAVRLGSIDRYDRRGIVYDLDDFEGIIIRWKAAEGHANDSASLDGDSVRSGSQACKLYISGNVDSSVSLARGELAPSVTSLGFEISFSKLSTNSRLRCYFYLYTGEELIQAWVLLDGTDGKIYIYDDSGTWVEVADYTSFYDEYFVFHTVKLVADFANKQYKRLLFDNDEIDISATSLRSTASSTTPIVLLYIYFYPEALVADSIWLDDMVYTIEEP